MKYAILCDSLGETLCGTDGYIPLDGRFGEQRIRTEVLHYRMRFFKNFQHKWEHWTHYMITTSVTGTGKVMRI